jgi:hypothetical protein
MHSNKCVCYPPPLPPTLRLTCASLTSRPVGGLAEAGPPRLRQAAPRERAQVASMPSLLLWARSSSWGGRRVERSSRELSG